MVAAIYKYPVEVGTTELMLPPGARILTAQVQAGELQLWALVDPDAAPTISWWVIVVVTGRRLESPLLRSVDYLATFQLFDGAFVGHVFVGRS